jgi:hypothetical protein
MRFQNAYADHDYLLIALKKAVGLNSHSDPCFPELQPRIGLLEGVRCGSGQESINLADQTFHETMPPM